MNRLGHVGFIHEGLAGTWNGWSESFTRLANYDRYCQRSSATPQVTPSWLILSSAESGCKSWLRLIWLTLLVFRSMKTLERIEICDLKALQLNRVILFMTMTLEKVLFVSLKVRQFISMQLVDLAVWTMLLVILAFYSENWWLHNSLVGLVQVEKWKCGRGGGCRLSDNCWGASACEACPTQPWWLVGKHNWDGYALSLFRQNSSVHTVSIHMFSHADEVSLFRGNEAFKVW